MAFVSPTPLLYCQPQILSPVLTIRRPRLPTLLRVPTAVLQHDKVERSSSKSQQPAPGTPGHRFFEYTPDDIEAVRLRHCLVATEALAETVFKTVTSGTATLAHVSSSLSICEASRSRDGDLGWWWKDETAPRDVEQFGMNDLLLAAALTARPNVIQRVQTERGWHIFIVEQVRHVLHTKHERTPSRQNPNQKSRKSVDEILPPISGTYALHTLGCQMNRSDSERMAGELERRGLRLIDDAFRAQVLVLNTCNIRDHAESKVYSYVGQHATRKRRFPRDVTLCVAGCVAQQEGEHMLRRIPELDLVFGPQYVNRLGDLLDEVAKNGCQIAATDPIHIQEDISKPRRESSVTAWVNVIYGCGENCSFCTVGNVVRTVEQSRTMEAIRKEIEDIARSGIREVVLLGQNIDAYGRDMYPKRTFAELLRFIHDVDGIDRIRFTTSHPRYISTNLVTTCAKLEKIMPFFHIPPQSGDDVVLREMRRGYSIKDYLKVVNRIREHIPDAAICGDMIVGFPGETEEQFQKSLELMEIVKFDVMNTAAYSPRPQTPAAEMTEQIPEAIKTERLHRMNALVTEHALERSLRYVGRTEEVLVEQANPKMLSQVIGRIPTNRPVYFEGDIDSLKGKIVHVRIDEAFPFSLKGVMVGEAR